MHDCLAEGGILSLALPDKRRTFDRLRRCTALSDLVDAHFSGATAPSYRQVFDHVAYVRPEGADGPPEGHGLAAALRHCVSIRRKGRYFDVHCLVVTPEACARLLAGLAELGLLRLRVVDFVATPHGAHEFYVVLRRGAAGPGALPATARPDLPVPAGDHAALALEERVAVLVARDAALRGALAERDTTERELRAALAAHRDDIAGLRRAVAEQRDAAAARDRALADAEGSRAALADALAATEKARDRLAAELEALRRSTSWRLTAPLRRVAGRLRRWRPGRRG